MLRAPRYGATRLAPLRMNVIRPRTFQQLPLLQLQLLQGSCREGAQRLLGPGTGRRPRLCRLVKAQQAHKRGQSGRIHNQSEQHKGRSPQGDLSVHHLLLLVRGVAQQLRTAGEEGAGGTPQACHSSRRAPPSDRHKHTLDLAEHQTKGSPGVAPANEQAQPQTQAAGANLCVRKSAIMIRETEPRRPAQPANMTSGHDSTAQHEGGPSSTSIEQERSLQDVQ